MGVQGLWTLVSPAGRRVPAEILAGKIVAVDASIWIVEVGAFVNESWSLTCGLFRVRLFMALGVWVCLFVVQFLHGLKTPEGGPVPGAVLVGFFNRLCRSPCPTKQSETKQNEDNSFSVRTPKNRLLKASGFASASLQAALLSRASHHCFRRPSSCPQKQNSGRKVRCQEHPTAREVAAASEASNSRSLSQSLSLRCRRRQRTAAERSLRSVALRLLVNKLNSTKINNANSTRPLQPPSGEASASQAGTGGDGSSVQVLTGQPPSRESESLSVEGGESRPCGIATPNSSPPVTSGSPEFRLFNSGDEGQGSAASSESESGDDFKGQFGRDDV